jgi:N-acetylglucosamine-6-sulfatase
LSGAAAPPNVVLIVADDMRHDSVGAMATVSGLAERGVTFTRAFVTTPLCCPSRASIQTGLYARHHGVLTNTPPLGSVERFDDRSTLATWLQAAGVRTGLVGRYLNGYRSLRVPPGWEYWFAIWHSSEDEGLYYRYRVNHNGEDEFYGSSSERYSTRVLASRATRFLKQDRERPFLLMFTPRAPHGPATPDVHDAGTLKGLELALPPSYDEEDVGDKPGWVREHGRLSPAERDRLDGLRRRQLESLLGLDRAVGSILDELRVDGRLDRTWIIFTSDNGLTLGEHRLGIGKSCAYEECVRVPLIVVPPGGLPSPRTDDRLVANIDLAPTIAEIMGVAPAGPVDGRSLLPLLKGGSPAWREALVLELWSDADAGKGFVGLRTADRKYGRLESGEEELYDETADPYELQNLAGDPGWGAEKARLAERLEAALAEPSAGPAGR